MIRPQIEATAQSNYPPGTVPHPDHGCGLGTQHMQSGISRLAPPEPESELHSLPPILRNTCQVPIPRCSKGPRGLSVLPRVTSIFTRSAISPSPQLRQCPSRYAIRAGRNFVSVPCFQGDRLCLHLINGLEDRGGEISPPSTWVHAAYETDNLTEASGGPMVSPCHPLTNSGE